MRSQFSGKRRERNGKAGATAGNVKGKNSQGGETGIDLQTGRKDLGEEFCSSGLSRGCS